MFGLLFIALPALPDCSSDSESAVMVRALGEQRFGLLFSQMKDLATQQGSAEDFVKFEYEEIPAEFQDLNCHSILLYPDRGVIRLKHCIDHTQDIEFEGLTKPQIEKGEKPAIVLYSNEWDVEKEILWRSQ